MLAGLKTCLKMSKSDEAVLFDDELLLEEDDLDEDLEELELGALGPSGFWNANTTSEKWFRNSGSLRKASRHIEAISSGGFRKPGPSPNVPMQRLW
jgi:hypothetical protein